MILMDNIDNCSIKKSVVALGKFDGVHLGHQAILEELKKEKNRDKEIKTVIITFSISPEAVLSDKKLKYIMTDREKREYFEHSGIDYLIDIKLDKKFLNISAQDFVKEYLSEKLGAVKVVCGKNFRFGRDRQGTTDFLGNIGIKFGFETKIVDYVTIEKKEISSTRIRTEILKGNIELANKMLGHEYSVTGIVEHGRELGRTLCFPTINIQPPDDKILPPNGVYISECVISEKNRAGVTNLGIKPTVGGERIGIETNIFDYSGNLYGQEVTVRLLKFLREEKKFESIYELQEQIKKDIICAKREMRY
ncbi:MAG: bifunctional riboflavin kinase/FAD synthetase [Lachnospiraceae bacterium]|nr:bifunctional riboflavin kinase/FAD synthetase [Lachnospiraceae bacterium]